MSSPFGTLHVIVNPGAGRGAVERGWPDARAVLDEAGVKYEVTITERRGHAAEAARRAIEEGRRFIVAVGGDGTVHEVVNGMMGDDGPLDPEAVLGVVAAGSGCDFARTFGLPPTAADAARHLLGDTLWGRLDIGKLTYDAGDGRTVSRWFVNVAETGLGAEVVMLAETMPKWLGASVYRLAAIRSVKRDVPSRIRLTMHGRLARGRVGSPLEHVVHEGDASMVVVANCQFFGGGMRVAPRAIPQDGMLDVLVMGGPKRRALPTMQKMFKGEHVPSKDIVEYLASELTLEAEPAMPIEADGEVLGRTPLTVSLVRGAFSLKI